MRGWRDLGEWLDTMTRWMESHGFQTLEECSAQSLQSDSLYEKSYPARSRYEQPEAREVERDKTDTNIILLPNKSRDRVILFESDQVIRSVEFRF